MSLERQRAWAVHGDGMDELATTGPSEVHDVTPSGIRFFEVIASDLGGRSKEQVDSKKI